MFARFSLYGDFWTRMLVRIIRYVPWWVERLLVPPLSFLFLLAAKNQRQAVLANLRVIRPELSPWERFWGASSVFRNFAWMMIDSTRSRLGQHVMTWSVEGLDDFEKLASGPGGALLLTAHMGHYDLAAPFFAGKFARKLHTVRVPERRPEMQAFMEKVLREQTSDAFAVQYNAEGGFLGIELAQTLARGEFVAIQGDRVMMQVAGVEARWNDAIWPLPKGPFVLAQAARVPIFPIFMLREGWRKARIRVGSPWYPPQVRLPKDELFQQMLEWWSSVLQSVIYERWSEWLMFEPAFRSAEEKSDPTTVDVPQKEPNNPHNPHP